MKVALSIVSICALVSLCACRSADQPPLRKGEPLSLRLNVPSDSTRWVESTNRQMGRYGFMGEEIRIEGVTRFVYELHAIQRSRSGDTQFSITPRIYEVTDHVVTPNGDRMRPPEMDALFKTMEAAIKLRPFTFTVGVNGGITHIEGLTDLENLLAGAITREDLIFERLDPLYRHAWRRVFMAHIDDRPIRRHLHETYGFLPGGLVRRGDEWPGPREATPWPYLPVRETTRLIDKKEGYWYIQTAGEFDPPPESGWATYKGGKRGTVYVDPVTGLGGEREESVYWKRKRGRTPWEQFTLKSLEAASSVRIHEGPMGTSPPLYAIHRYPFMEATRSKAAP